MSNREPLQQLETVVSEKNVKCKKELWASKVVSTYQMFQHNRTPNPVYRLPFLSCSRFVSIIDTLSATVLVVYNHFTRTFVWHSLFAYNISVRMLLWRTKIKSNYWKFCLRLQKWGWSMDAALSVNSVWQRDVLCICVQIFIMGCTCCFVSIDILKMQNILKKFFLQDKDVRQFRIYCTKLSVTKQWLKIAYLQMMSNKRALQQSLPVTQSH